MDLARDDSFAEAQLYALVDVAAAAAGAHRLDEVLELAAERSLAAIGGASLSIGRWEEGFIVTLINVGDLGPGEQRFPTNERYPLSKFPTTERVLAGGGMMVSAVDDPASDPAHRELLRSLGKQTSLTVPIVFEGSTWGELWATSGIGSPRFLDQDARFLRAIADQIAAAVGRAELFAQVEALAYTDPLTGLANRRRLEQTLERACERASGNGSPALVLCDIDGLKAVNDSEGHDAGDRAIVRVATALSAAAAAHPDAVVSRIGGDEFCVLLPSGDGAAARAVSRETVRRLKVGSGVELSISCGISASGPELTRPAALLRAADFAQYQAKAKTVGIPAEPASRGLSGAPPSPDGARAFRDGAAARQELAAELLLLMSPGNGHAPQQLLDQRRRRLADEASLA